MMLLVSFHHMSWKITHHPNKKCKNGGKMINAQNHPHTNSISKTNHHSVIPQPLPTSPRNITVTRHLSWSQTQPHPLKSPPSRTPPRIPVPLWYVPLPVDCTGNINNHLHTPPTTQQRPRSKSQQQPPTPHAPSRPKPIPTALLPRPQSPPSIKSPTASNPTQDGAGKGLGLTDNNRLRSTIPLPVSPSPYYPPLSISTHIVLVLGMMCCWYCIVFLTLWWRFWGKCGLMPSPHPLPTPSFVSRFNGPYF